jgi:hypothetical protein
MTGWYHPSQRVAVPTWSQTWGTHGPEIVDRCMRAPELDQPQECPSVLYSPLAHGNGATAAIDIDSGTFVLVHQTAPDRVAAPGGAPRSGQRRTHRRSFRTPSGGIASAARQGGIRHRLIRRTRRLFQPPFGLSFCGAHHHKPVPETGWKPPCPEHGGFRLSPSLADLQPARVAIARCRLDDEAARRTPVGPLSAPGLTTGDANTIHQTLSAGR